MTRRKGAAKVTVHCHGCDKTQVLRPSKIERCDGYACAWDHGPQERQAPGLIREIVYNAAGGFWGWRDVVPTAEEMAAVDRARAIAVLGVAQQIVSDASTVAPQEWRGERS